MARLYVGGPVPNRRQRQNPETITGRPQIGTFQGMGMRTVCTDLRIQASNAGVKIGKGGSKNKKLDPADLAHRCKPKLDYVRGIARNHAHNAKRVSYTMDHMFRRGGWLDIDVMATATGEIYIKAMQYLRVSAPALYSEQIRLERVRGSKWYRLIPTTPIEQAPNALIPLIHPTWPNGQGVPRSYVKP